MPYSNPSCPNCGKPTMWRIDEAYPPQPGKRPLVPMFQRHGYWYEDVQLMCGYCRNENWLSRWRW